MRPDQLNIRVSREEIDEFRECAEREGHQSLTAWILWHLRRVVRQSEPPKT